MSIWDICIRRPVFTTMLVLGPVVLGLASYFRLGVELFPNVDIPVVVVTTTLKGASVDEMESAVTKEVELLTDNITRFNPNTDTTLNVQFSVYGVVLAEEEAEFLAEFGANANRIHEQIMLTIHSAESADLANAGLGLIKRQILEKTNRTLGRPMLREVVFTKLNFVER